MRVHAQARPADGHSKVRRERGHRQPEHAGGADLPLEVRHGAVVVRPAVHELHRVLVAVAERDATTIVGGELRVLDLQPLMAVLLDLVGARVLRLGLAGAEPRAKPAGGRLLA